MFNILYSIILILYISFKLFKNRGFYGSEKIDKT